MNKEYILHTDPTNPHVPDAYEIIKTITRAKNKQVVQFDYHTTPKLFCLIRCQNHPLSDSYNNIRWIES